MRDIRAIAARRSPAAAMPVIAVIGAGAGEDRSIAALNFALAAARDGANVLMIDADHADSRHLGQGDGPRQARAQPSRLAQHRHQGFPRDQDRERNLDPARDQGRRRQGGKRRRHPQGDRAGPLRRRLRPRDPRRTGDALEPADRKLLDYADSLVAILPVSLDINDAMEDIITALGGTERKLIGVVLNELQPATVNPQRDQQYA